MEWDSGDCGTCCTEANLLVELQAAEGDLAGLAVLAEGTEDGGGLGAGDLLRALDAVWRNLLAAVCAAACQEVAAEQRVGPKLPILTPAALHLQAGDDSAGALELLGERRDPLFLLCDLLFLPLQQLDQLLDPLHSSFKIFGNLNFGTLLHNG